MKRTWIAAAFATAAGIASLAQAVIVNIATQGVLVTDAGGVCTTFLGDDGGVYFLSSTGGFTTGDRFFVAGSYDTNQSGLCLDTLAPQVAVTEASPAFAGIGTLSLRGERGSFIADDGRTFSLTNTGGFTSGTRLYVQGKVTPARVGGTINVTAIGRPYAAFGRLWPTPSGGFQLETSTGPAAVLDRPGSTAGIAPGDYVYVEGIARATRFGVSVTSVTARPAFEAVGKVISQGSGVAFIADSIINFDQPFTASALQNFAAGTKVYLRGRRADDYDYGEVKTPRDIRLSSASAGYSGVGVLNAAARTVSIPASGGNPATTVNVSFTGNPVVTPDGSLVYVAGAIASQSAGIVTLSHNEMRLGIDAEGYIRVGFGCTPIIVFNNGAYVFPRTTGGLPLNEYVRVVGGFSRDVPCLDGQGLVDNTIEVTPCPDCE